MLAENRVEIRLWKVNYGNKSAGIFRITYILQSSQYTSLKQVYVRIFVVLLSITTFIGQLFKLFYHLDIISYRFVSILVV